MQGFLYIYYTNVFDKNGSWTKVTYGVPRKELFYFILFMIEARLHTDQCRYVMIKIAMK